MSNVAGRGVAVQGEADAFVAELANVVANAGECFRSLRPDDVGRVRAQVFVWPEGPSVIRVYRLPRPLPPLSGYVFRVDLLDDTECAALLHELPPSLRPDARRLIRRARPDIAWTRDQLRRSA